MKAAPGAGLGDWIYSYFVWGKEFTAARPSCVQYLDLYLLRLEHIIHTYVCVAHFAGLSQEKFQVSRNSVSRFVLAHHYILTIVIIHECVYKLTYSRCGLWFGILNFLRRWGTGAGKYFRQSNAERSSGRKLRRWCTSFAQYILRWRRIKLLAASLWMTLLAELDF